MPLYADDFNDVLKSISQHQKDLQPTKEELKAQAKAQRQKELLAQVKAGTANPDGTPKKKGLLSRVAGQVKDTAVGIAKSAKKDAVDAFDTLEGGAAATVELGRGITAHATGNKAAEQAAIDRANKDFKKVTDAGVISQEALDNGYSSKAAFKDTAKGVLRYGQYVAPEAKVAKGASVARKVATKAASGAVVNTGLEAGNELLTDGKLDKSKLAQSAALGLALGGAPEVVKGAKRAKKVKTAEFDKTATPEGLVDDPNGVSKLAGDLSNEDRMNQLSAEAEAAQTAKRQTEFSQEMATRDINNRTTNGSNLLPENATGKPVRPLEQVDADIRKLQTEGDPTLTADETKAKFQALQRERQVAATNEAETGFTLERNDAARNFESNGLPNTPDEAQQALDNFDSNGAPETAYKADTPVQSAQEVFSHPNMPEELKSAATELLDDRGKVEGTMASLVTKDKAKASHAQMDQAYKDRQAEIAEMPAPRQEVEQQKLDDKYMQDVQELDDAVEKDAPDAEKYQTILDHLNDKESQLVEHSNMLMRDNPDSFRSPDIEEIQAQRAPLEQNLEQAKRFNNADAIVDDVADHPNPQKLVDTDVDVRKAYGEETANNVPSTFKNVGNVREAVLGLMSPSKNLEAMGQRDLHNAIVLAETATVRATKEDFKTIAEIAPALKGNAELNDQIVDYLEGKRKTLSAAPDQEVADKIRAFLDEKRATLDSLGYKTLDDYFPQVFDKSDPEVQRLFKNPTTGNINFGNLKQRKGNAGDYSRDILEVLSQYSKGYNRKVHLEPALKPLQDLKLQANITKGEADWVDEYIEQLKGIREPSSAEKVFNGIVDSALGVAGKQKGGSHYRKTLGAQRMISSVATMGMNPGTAIRNLTQAVNTVAGIGPKYSTAGAIKATRAFSAGKNSPEWKEMIDSGVFDSGGISGNYESALPTEKGLSPKVESATKFMMGMIRGTDVTLRAHTYWGAKALAISKGMSEAEAKKFAVGKVTDTQFITNAVDMPTKLNGPGVRSLTQLATFSVKQAEFMASNGVKLIKREDGTYGLNGTQAVNVMSAAVAAGLTTAALQPVIGFSPKEWVPFYDQIAPLVDPNSTADASLYRSPLVTLFAGNGKGKIGLVDAIKSGKIEDFLTDNWSSLVPAGTQIKKTVEGIETTNSGISKNGDGKVRYLQDMTGNDKLKAAFFGQYSTKAGQDWIKSGFPTLTDSEMRLGSKEGSGDVTFEQLPREKQKVFYDYYAAAKSVTGRQKALDGIKAAAQSGDVNKAQRLGDEFNGKARAAMQDYFKKHNDLPQELQDKMVDQLFIDVGDKIDNTLDN